MIKAATAHYRTAIGDALAFASSRPAVPMTGRVASIYIFSLAWAAVSWLGGTSIKPHHFFVEGGTIDWLSTIYLLSAAALAWLAWIAGPRGSGTARFWLLCAVGLAFLVIDERFQLHEYAFGDWLEDHAGDEPPGFRTWNDFVVLVYGVLAIGLVLSVLPAVLRYRGFRLFLMLGFGFYGLHTFFDMADEFFNSAPSKEALEELAKLLSGASILLAFLQAVLCRSAEGREAGGDPARYGLRFRHGVVFLAGFSIVTVILLNGDPDWYKPFTHRWGDPVVWLVSVMLGVGALLSYLDAAGSTHGNGRKFGYAISAVLGVLALDEATEACEFRFRHRFVRDEIPEILEDGWTVLQHPLSAPALGALAVLIVLGFLGRRALAVDRGATVLYWAGVVSLGLLVPATLILGGDDAVLTEVLPAIGSAFLAAAALTRFAGSPTHGEPGSR